MERGGVSGSISIWLAEEEGRAHHGSARLDGESETRSIQAAAKEGEGQRKNTGRCRVKQRRQRQRQLTPVCRIEGGSVTRSREECAVQARRTLGGRDVGCSVVLSKGDTDERSRGGGGEERGTHGRRKVAQRDGEKSSTRQQEQHTGTQHTHGAEHTLSAQKPWGGRWQCACLAAQTPRNTLTPRTIEETRSPAAPQPRVPLRPFGSALSHPRSSREYSRDRPRRAAELARLTAPRAHAGLSTLDTCQSRLISLNLTREMLGKPSLAHRVLSPRPRRVLSSAGLAVTVSCAKRHRGRRVSVSLTAPASRDRTKSSLLDTFWLLRSRPACTRLGPLLLFSSRFAFYRA